MLYTVASDRSAPDCDRLAMQDFRRHVTVAFRKQQLAKRQALARRPQARGTQALRAKSPLCADAVFELMERIWPARNSCLEGLNTLMLLHTV